jgi:hypothetical protein
MHLDLVHEFVDRQTNPPIDSHDWIKETDGRTHHEALPLLKGVKCGANAWHHQRGAWRQNKSTVAPVVVGPEVP